MRLQYRLGSGTWIDCEDRTVEFLALCVQHGGLVDEAAVLAALAAGKELLNCASEDAEWYAYCRDGDVVDARRAAKLSSAPVPVPLTWGSSGVRYDERCERCGRETEVDNGTSLCRRCS